MTLALAVALAAVVVVSATLVTFLDRRRRGARRRAARLELRATSAEAAAHNAAAELAGASASAAAAQAAAEAATRAAEAASRREAIVSQVLGALWALAGYELRLERQRAAALSTATDPGGEETTLQVALEAEVERVREEVGTPGSVRSGLPERPEPATALMALAAERALLGALARRCDAFDLYVHEWEGAVAAVALCEGYAGPEDLGEEGSSLRAALAPAGGELSVDRDARGRFRARLRIPLPRPGDLSEGRAL